jgi:SAM-dependent methyltransferase
MRTNDADIISGNCAKYFAQKEIMKTLHHRVSLGKSSTVVDLGCGDGSKWAWLASQRWSSQIRFFGFDPDAEAIKKAQARFPSWTLVAAPAYAIKAVVDTADVIVSFSTLEHVYKRREFIQAARSIMLGSSEFYLNYDNGHFLGPGEWRNIFGPVLARLGVERYYQSFVWQGEVEGLLKDCELQVVRELNFHQATRKEFQKVLADTSSMKHYMDAWLDFELKVNAFLEGEPKARREANSNKYHLSKLFILRLSSDRGGG